MKPIHLLSPTLVLFLSLVGTGAEKITYDDQVLPIFEQSCLNCHNPDKTKGGLDLSSFAATLKGSSGGKIVQAGDNASSLLAAVMQTGEPKMPPEGDKLPKAHIATLKSWIEGGLLESKNSKARKPSKPKFDASLKSDPGAKPDGPPPMPQHVLLEPQILASRPSAVFDMAASPWAPLLAVTGQRQVLLFDSETLELAGLLPFPEGDPVSLAFTPNARYLIVGGGIPGKSGITVTFDVTNGQRVLTAAKEFDTVLATDLSPDLASVVTGSPSRLIKLWKTEDGSQTASIKKHSEWVTSLDFSPDGILLASADRNGGVWVWEATSGNEFHTLRAHQAAITSARFRADSNVLATASEDGSLRFWEMNNGKEIKKIDAHPGGILAFSWARDGSFATAGRDKKMKLWKPDFGLRHEIKALPDIPTAIALDAEGKRVFIADFNGTIFVHQVENGKRIGELDSNPPTIASRLKDLRQQLSESEKSVITHKAHQQESATNLEAARQHLRDTGSQVDKTKQTIVSFQNKLNEQHKSQQDILEQRKQLQKQLLQLLQQKTTLETQTPPPAELAETLMAVSKLKTTEKQLQKQENAIPNRITAVTQALADARKRATEINKISATAQSAIKPAEETVDKSNSSLVAARQQHQQIQKRESRWAAAKLNAEAIKTAAEATKLEQEGEFLADNFAALNRSFEQQSNQLSKQIAELAKLENEVIKTRHQLDTILPKAHQLRTKANELHSCYQESLNPVSHNKSSPAVENTEQKSSP